MLEDLLNWQWSDYANKHARRANLLLHLLVVPWFWMGALLVCSTPFTSLWEALLGVLLIGLSLSARGRGHCLEGEAPAPFNGPLDAATRLLAEQFFTFPRYLLTGGWWRAWRGRPVVPPKLSP